MRKTVLSFLGAVLISMPALAQTSVKLNASASPSSGQPGVTSVSVTGSGFPSGTISPSAVTVTLTPSGGSAVTTTASSVGTVIGSTKIVGFLIPGSISVSSPTVYAVTIAGQTTTGTAFQSSNASSLTINPLPFVSSVSPNSGLQGQTLSVTITGQYTSFAIGATQANFGLGISVGGAAAGANGPVSVTSATTATANLTIAGDATVGNRNVTVVTGSQTASLANGFAVNASADHPPVAVPGGPYSATRPAAVQFNGTSSYDPDSGDTIFYDWNFGDGTTHGSGPTPSHVYASSGTYTGSLVVTDNHGVSSSAVGFTVTVNAATPVAVPGGPYSATLPTAVVFNGSSSYDPDPSVTLTFTWNFGDGSAPGTGTSPSHTYTAPGTYTGSLVVTDNHGVTSAAAGFMVTISPAVPVAVPGGPYSATLPMTVQFNGSSSYDPDPNATITYSWNFGDGSAPGTGATPSHTYINPGSYSGSLTVTDNHGTSSTSVGFVVTITPATPVAVPGGPYTEHLPGVLQFNGSSSYDPDPNATITYNWDFGDGTAHGSGAQPTHTYATAGSFNGTLIVTDNHGVSSAPVGFMVTVTTSQGNPIAVPGGPYNVQLPAAVQFDGSGSSDPNSGATLSYDWNFGDGTPDGTGAKPTHTYATAGTYNGTLTVTDSLGLSSGPVAFTVTVGASAPPPQLTITSPQALTVFNASGNPITVAGTIDNSNDTVTVNGVAATVSGGTFTVSGIVLREGANVITAIGTDSVGNVGTASETVTLNTTPPQLGILAPTDGAVLATSTTTVAGNVNEQVPGTINAKQVVVMVNGIAAVVSNRTFSASNVPLVQGMNTITVVATDPAGNTSQAQIHVTYMGTIPVQKILKVSGESQTAAVNTTLPQPLVIEAVDSNGAPVPNQSVTFTVVKSDGALTSTNQQGQTVTAVTDQNGQASVQFMLGSRVGVGNNQVSATAPGFVGQALFCETSTVGPPAKILVEMGDQQTGLAGQALPSPLVVEVFDAGGNPVSYVPITFNVEQGGGNFNGNATLQVSTDINGMASALLTLGQQEGINNNVVSATFGGNVGPAASFVASGQAAGPASITSISGLVEDDSNTPVPGATIVLEGTNYTAVSDQNGNFKISPAPVGTFLLQVNGHTSTRTDAVFPTLAYTITTIAGLNNTLGMPVCLPPLDPTSVQTYDPTSSQSLTLQMTGIPGYTFTVAPHSVFNPDGTAYSGPLSLSQVHADRVPMAPPHGSLPLIAGTLQPPGLHFNPPVTTQFPNTSGLAPGTVLDVYSYDHDQMDWVSQGPARVSADGSVILSDPGFGISKSGWHFPPPPPPPPKCASACTTTNPCQTSSCVNGACVTKPANEGGECDDGSSSGDECGGDGKCMGGSCVFDTTAKDGTPCTPENKCLKDPKCMGGQCTGQPIDTSSWTDDAAIAEQVNFPEELTSGIASAISTATGGNIVLEGLNISAKGQEKTCCKEDTGPIDGGEAEGSGSGQLSAHVKGLPVGPSLPSIFKIVTIPFTGKQLQLEIALGAYFGADITLNGEIGVRDNQCEPDKSCGFGQVDLSFEPSIFLQGTVTGCASIYTPLDECIGLSLQGGVKLAISGGVRYHKPDCMTGLNGFISFGQPVFFITAKASFLGVSYSFSFQYTFKVWPVYVCSYPGGCHAEQ